MRRLTTGIAALLVLVNVVAFLSIQVTAKQVHLTFTAWGGPSHVETYRMLAEAFNKRNPNISIEFIPDTGDYVAKLKVNVLAGTGPDIYFCQEMQTVGFIKEGWFIPLNDFIKNDENFDINQIHQGLFESFTWQGKIGALPVVAFDALLFYNPVLFDEAGTPAPKALTWADLVTTAKKLTKRSPDGRVIQYGHRVEYWPNFNLYYLWQNGGGILDDSKRRSLLNTPETIGAVQYIHDLAWVHQVIPKPSEMGEFLIEKGNLAMFTHGSWMIGYYVNEYKCPFDVAPLPTNKQEITMAYPNGFGISAASRHPAEAWEFLKFVSGPEGQKIIAQRDLGIPVSKHPSVLEAYIVGPSARQRAVAIMNLAKARAPRVVPGMQDIIIDRYVGPPLYAVWENRSAPDQVLKEAHRQVQEYLDKLYATGR